MKKIELNLSELFNKVQSISKVQTNKNMLPVLDNIRFVCKDGLLSMDAAEEGCFAHTWMSVESGEDVTFGINSKSLREILKTIPEQNITIEINHASCIIRHNRGKMELPNVSMEEWPETPGVDVENFLSIPAETLKNIFTHCSPFIMVDELRPVMNTICLRFGNHKMDAVASDGHTLIKQTYHCDYSSTEEKTLLVFNRFGKVVEQLIGKQTEPVGIYFNKTHILFRLQNFDCTIRQVEGNYPNYNSVIPNDHTDSLSVNKKEFMQGLDFVNPCANTASMILALTVGDNEIHLRTADADYGKSADTTVPAEITGQKTVVGLKCTYLTEILKHIHTEEVVMTYSNGHRAWVFLPKEQMADSEQVIILMPMMLNA